MQLKISPLSCTTHISRISSPQVAKVAKGADDGHFHLAGGQVLLSIA